MGFIYIWHQFLAGSGTFVSGQSHLADHSHLQNSWITNLPTYFSASNLTVLSHEAHSLLPIYRKAWNDDNLIGTYAAVDRIKDDAEREKMKEIHAKAAAEAANGWWVDWKLIVCVGREGILRKPVWGEYERQ